MYSSVDWSLRWRAEDSTVLTMCPFSRATRRQTAAESSRHQELAKGASRSLTGSRLVTLFQSINGTEGVYARCLKGNHRTKSVYKGCNSIDV